MIHAVIMAGGKGERFWPLSRFKTPKQLLNIVGRKTMLEQTVARLKPLGERTRIWVVTNIHQVPAIKALLPQLPRRHILSEPVGRNTAPAITLAAYAISREDPEGVMVVLPSDHVISPRNRFIQTLKACLRAASRNGDNLITIGIEPTYPATGYGYINRGKLAFLEGPHPFYIVRRFTEKPDETTARRFLRSRHYSWNSGMFVWSVRAILQAINQHLPEIGQRMKPIALRPASRRDAFLKRIYPVLPSISIDCGVMEKHKNVLVTPATFEWDDVGSWESLFQHYRKDSQNNCGKGTFIATGASDCIVVSTKPLVGLVGVSDLIVVATEDAVLVCSRQKAQEVKKLVQKLQKNQKYRSYI